MAQQEDPTDEQYLTASQAALELGTTRMKVGELLKKGILPYESYALDRRVKLIPLSAVRRLQGKRVIGPKAPAARTRRDSAERAQRAPAVA